MSSSPSLSAWNGLALACVMSDSRGLQLSSRTWPQSNWKILLEERDVSELKLNTAFVLCSKISLLSLSLFSLGVGNCELEITITPNKAEVLGR